MEIVVVESNKSNTRKKFFNNLSTYYQPIKFTDTQLAVLRHLIEIPHLLAFSFSKFLLNNIFETFNSSQGIVHDKWFIDLLVYQNEESDIEYETLVTDLMVNYFEEIVSRFGHVDFKLYYFRNYPVSNYHIYRGLSYYVSKLKYFGAALEKDMDVCFQIIPQDIKEEVKN